MGLMAKSTAATAAAAAATAATAATAAAEDVYLKQFSKNRNEALKQLESAAC